MPKYIARMYFTATHNIEFEADDDEVAIQMIEDDCGLHYILDHKQAECLKSDECFPVRLYLNQDGGKEVWRL